MCHRLTEWSDMQDGFLQSQEVCMLFTVSCSRSAICSKCGACKCKRGVCKRRQALQYCYFACILLAALCEVLVNLLRSHHNSVGQLDIRNILRSEQQTGLGTSADTAPAVKCMNAARLQLMHTCIAVLPVKVRGSEVNRRSCVDAKWQRAHSCATLPLQQQLPCRNAVAAEVHNCVHAAMLRLHALTGPPLSQL